MANDKIYLPTKDQQDQLLSLIGKTNDTGGSASAGSTNAKLNSLINTIGTINSNVSGIINNQDVAWGSIVTARDNAYQANVNSNQITNLIGATNDSYGTASYTAGSLMAKINRLIMQIETQSINARLRLINGGVKAIRYSDYTWTIGSSNGTGTQRINYSTNAVKTTLDINNVFGMGVNSNYHCKAIIVYNSNNYPPLPVAAYMENNRTLALIAPHAASDNNATVLIQFYIN